MTTKIKARTKRVNITERTVMLSVEFHRIGNSRRLPSSQFEVDADKQMVRASKRLLASNELKVVSRFDGQVRDYIASRALPSMIKGGFWLVPIELLEQLDAKLEEFALARQPLVETFVQAYPELMKDAEEKLRGVFNESDYLSEEDVRKQFAFSWRYVTFGVPEQLEAIKEAVYKREQEKAAEHWEQATEEVQNLLRAAMADLVEHMVERLAPGADGKPKVFKSSTVDNIVDFVKTFDARNVTGDAELKQLVDKARSLMAGVDAEAIRTNDDLRAKMMLGMASLKQSLDGMVITKPARRIRYDEAKPESVQ